MPTHFLDTDTPLTDAIEMEPGVYTRGVQDDDDLDFLWNKEQRKAREPEKFNMWFFAAGNATGAIITSIIFMVYIWQMGPMPSNAKPNDVKPKATVEEKVVSPTDLRPAAQPTGNNDALTMDDSELPEEITDPIAEIPEEETPAPAPVKAKTPVAKPKDKGVLGGVFGLLKPKAATPKVDPDTPTIRTTPTSTAQKPVATPVKASVKTTAAVTTAVGGTTYVVKSGDTLGSIAYQFYKEDWANQVDNLQKANKLKSVNSLQIGHKIVVPAAIKH